MNSEETAYIMLEVDRVAVESAPKITYLFKYVPGGLTKVWEMLEASDSRDARRLVEFRRRLKKEEFESVPFEAIVVAAGMTTKHGFGVVSEAMVEFSQDASKLILHAAGPEMMEKAVENAKQLDGTSERKTLLQALNLVPRPRNTITVVNGDVVKGNKNLAILPAQEDIGRRLGDRFNVEMKIPAALAAPVVEVELEDGDDEDQ